MSTMAEREAVTITADAGPQAFMALEALTAASQ
jgi:hypothetical protein